MVDAIIIPIAFAIGAAAGAFSAFLGWIKSGDVFETKKFILGLVTGVIAGLTLVIANVTVIQGATDTEVLIQLTLLVLAIVGVDQVRTSISGAVSARAKAVETK